MLVTSFTSSVAFLACTVSPIMPIRSFGIFACIVVLNCFFITILVQPINYYLYEMFFKNIFWKDKRLIEPKSYEAHQRREQIQDELEDINGMNLKPISNSSVNFNDFIQHEASGNAQSLFENYISKWIFKYKHMILIIGTTFYVNNSHNLSLIRQESRDPSLLKESNPI